VQPFIRNSSLIGECFIVHSHDEIQAFYFRYFSALRKIPLVTTFHGLPPSGVGQLSAEKRKVLYEYVALVLVNTQFAKDQVCRLGCDESKVRIMPQGLPIDDFPFCPRALPESEEVLQLLTVGRFHRDKGQGYGLLALKRLVNNGIRVHWTFVGVGQDIGRLKKLVSKLGLAENVTFLQGVSSEDLLEFYRTAHIFVLSSNVSPGSHIETQGVVLQEAQASGCVPIASAVGGIPECINHQRDGLLVRQKSSRAIFSAVKYLLARPEEWSKYQCAGRANVEQNFSADVVGEQMSRVLKNTAMTWGKKNEHLLSI
jgi:glycosyltransferase involved in cell wall biosynthesis